MNAEELHKKIRELSELADMALDWIINPADDAPPSVLVGHLADDLAELERDLQCELLAEVGR